MISGVTFNLKDAIEKIPKLKEDNYTEWKKKLDLAFVLADVEWIKTTPCPLRPEAPVRQDGESDADWHKRERDNAPIELAYSIDKKTWDNTNKKCCAVIKNTIEPVIMGSIAKCDTTTEYLKKIKSQFYGSLKTYTTQIIKKLMTS